MNSQLEQFARQTLKDQCAQLPDDWNRTFKLMYGRGKITRGVAARTVDEACAIPINDVIDEVPPDKLDWAMSQVANSIRKLT